MHQSGSYSGSKCMDEQAVCPLSYSEMMTVGPSAPPIMPMADVFPGSAPLCVLSPSAQSVISSASFDISGEMSTRRSVKNLGSPFRYAETAPSSAV